MKRITLIAAVATTFALASSSAQAIPRTFVSGTGGGATCTRAAPCATFQAAHDATDLGGEVDCLDAGTYGGVIITKSITIDCTGTLGVAGQININTPSVTVRLRNLTIDTAANPLIGVILTNGSALFIENCVLSGNTQAVVVSPVDGLTARLFVTDSSINRNSSNGIFSFPGGSGSVRATVDGARIQKSNSGVTASEVSATTGSSLIHLRNSVVTENASNIAAFSTSGTGIISITVDRSSSTLSSGDGIESAGSSSFIVLGRSTVMSNAVGLHSNSNGQILSYKNNHLSGNVTDSLCDPGACTQPPTAALSLK
jgi:hypothetical protein